MRAHLSSVRLAPKKANLIAKMVRGMRVPDAMDLLHRTSKKSARIIEGVLRSAIANAEHNFKQDAQMLTLKSIIVNQGTAYRRGTPMARGRVRPIKKFLSHITIELGIAPAGDKEIDNKRRQKNQRKQKNQKSERSEQQTVAPSQKKSRASSVPSASSASSSSSK